MQIVFASENPNALASFWRLALGYVEEPPPEGYNSWDEFAAAMDLPSDIGQDLASAIDPHGVGPRLFCERAPEPKADRNRVHVDINIGESGQLPLAERKPKVDALAKTLLDAGAPRSRPWNAAMSISSRCSIPKATTSVSSEAGNPEVGFRPWHTKGKSAAPTTTAGPMKTAAREKSAGNATSP